MTLFDTALNLLVPHAANWICSGRVPGRLGSAHPNIAPYDKFAAGDGEIFLGILNDGQFRHFCQQVGRARPARRSAFPDQCRSAPHVAALRTELERTLAAFKSDDLCRELMRSRRPRRGRQHGAAGFRAAACHPPRHAGRKRRPSRPRHPRQTLQTPGGAGRRPPHFSEHSREILADAGFDRAAIDDLIEAGVVTLQRKENAQR